MDVTAEHVRPLMQEAKRMTLYALIVNDRHRDTEVRVFANPDLAVAAAREEIEARSWELDREGPADWLISASNPHESDHLQVVPVELESR